jgi:hypothetical protein
VAVRLSWVLRGAGDADPTMGAAWSTTATPETSPVCSPLTSPAEWVRDRRADALREPALVGLLVRHHLGTECREVKSRVPIRATPSTAGVVRSRRA